MPPLTPTPRDPGPGDPKTPLVWGQGVPGPRRDTRGQSGLVLQGGGEKVLECGGPGSGLCRAVPYWQCQAVPNHPTGARLCQTMPAVPGCAELCHVSGAQLCQTALVVLGCAKLCHISRARLCQTIPVVPGWAEPFRAGGARPCYVGRETEPKHASSARLCQAKPCHAGGARLCQTLAVVPCRGSEGHAGAVVPQLAGQDAAVDLVELHELDEVGEARLPVVHGEVEPTLLLALPGGCRSGPLSPSPPTPPAPGWHSPAG